MSRPAAWCHELSSCRPARGHSVHLLPRTFSRILNDSNAILSRQEADRVVGTRAPAPPDQRENKVEEYRASAPRSFVNALLRVNMAGSNPGT
jgi:hypothetical protein